MGYFEKALADSGGLTGPGTVQLAGNGLLPGSQSANAPIQGIILRDGQAIPFTLSTARLEPETPRLLPEQVAIAALLLVSFVSPIYHFLG